MAVLINSLMFVIDLLVLSFAYKHGFKALSVLSLIGAIYSIILISAAVSN